MANLLDRFNISVVGSSGKIADILPFISPKGDFKRVTNLDVILNSWNNILLTSTRTYFFDPEYGSDLYKKVFDPVDEETAELIEDEIMDKLMYYDNRASIDKINVEFTTNKKGFNVSVVVDYDGEKKELNTWMGEESFGNILRTV